MEMITQGITESELVAETRWTEVRAIRDAKLKGADTLINIVTDMGADDAVYRQYRQALRDIPQTYSNPDEVIWPQKPSLPQSSS